MTETRPPAEGRPRVGVIGNLNIDLIMRSVPELPRWGGEIEAIDHIAATAGQAGYLALALARLGVEVTLVGCVGDDPYGAQIVAELREAGVGLTGVATSQDRPTGITVAIVRPDGERGFVSDFGATRDIDGRFLSERLDLVRDCPIVCLVGLFNLRSLALPDAACALRDLRAGGIATVLDTGWDPGGFAAETVEQMRELLSAVDIFLPNLDEARALLGPEVTPDSAVAALRDLGPTTVIVKAGAEGGQGYSEGVSVRVPVFPTKAYDSVGAGDTFDAAYLRAFLDRLGTREAITFASAAASHYVGRATDRFPTLADVRAVLATSPEITTQKEPAQ